ncbi:MAG: flavodoxin domain-containing protein [Acholeplasmatales bacterium]|nr:flavodoxin domain-containing protein [Acholeplasmatales bacterium]
MKKIVVYWSGTGNTEEIANKIAADLGCDAFSVSAISASDALENDLIIFGCPAMGAEELEDAEFKPFYDEVMASIGDKKIALFGSYGWGDGEWMRNWEAEVGANLVTNGLIVNGGASDIDDSEYQRFIGELNI